jgi:hypothetical protein
MKVIIDPHTIERAAERGANEKEIIDTLEHGVLNIAKGGRKSRAKLYPFELERNGKYYEQKKIEVIFVEEGDNLVTVTVYV